MILATAPPTETKTITPTTTTMPWENPRRPQNTEHGHHERVCAPAGTGCSAVRTAHRISPPTTPDTADTNPSSSKPSSSVSCAPTRTHTNAHHEYPPSSSGSFRKSTHHLHTHTHTHTQIYMQVYLYTNVDVSDISRKHIFA